jgi:hypothetical protein
MLGDDDEDCNYDDGEADLIPGDNSLPEPASTVPTVPNPDAPDNLTHIPAEGGDVPIVLEPEKPHST